VRRLVIALLGGLLVVTGLAGGAAIAGTDATAAPDTTVASGDDTGGDTGGEGTTPAADLAPVDVLQVTGLFDRIVIASIDDAIDSAVRDGSQALILQVNSGGSIASPEEMTALIRRVADSPVPIGIWVGPSGSARLYGQPAQLMGVADVTAMVSGSRIGHTGVLVELEGGAVVDFGNAADRLRSGSLSFQDARTLGALKLDTPDVGVPTIRNMVAAMDGVEVDGVVLDTVTEGVNDEGGVELQATLVRFSKLGLVDQLMHTVASVPVAYLLLLIGLALLLFEFFTAGVGIAGVVGAACTFLAGFGLAELPARGWAVALLVLAMLAFAVDVQVGIPRFWTGVGIVLVTAGSLVLYEPLPGTGMGIGWLTLLVGIGGTALTFIVGMPSMTRTRFATPTIGREWMIGETGVAVGDVSPDGVVTVANARWRARTNRATPIAAGDTVRVVAIDGVTLEVEPESGGARDYRERRGPGAESGTTSGADSGAGTPVGAES
jgi:membrane-bound serine protease (ClpP class)